MTEYENYLKRLNFAKLLHEGMVAGEITIPQLARSAGKSKKQVVAALTNKNLSRKKYLAFDDALFNCVERKYNND